jgi:hypothetical protein
MCKSLTPSRRSHATPLDQAVAKAVWDEQRRSWLATEREQHLPGRCHPIRRLASRRVSTTWSRDCHQDVSDSALRAVSSVLVGGADTTLPQTRGYLVAAARDKRLCLGWRQQRSVSGKHPPLLPLTCRVWLSVALTVCVRTQAHDSTCFYST